MFNFGIVDVVEYPALWDHTGQREWGIFFARGERWFINNLGQWLNS